MPQPPEYYRMRAAHCRAMAESATDPAVRRIHNDLAKRYAQQAEEAAGDLAKPDIEQARKMVLANQPQ